MADHRCLGFYGVLRVLGFEGVFRVKGLRVFSGLRVLGCFRV